MRILCMWLPYWATTRLRHGRNAATPHDADAAGGRPGLDTTPLATVETIKGIRRLASICAGAEQAGLRPGQALSEARALYPALEVAEADPVQDNAALADLAQWCIRATPLAAAAPPDVLWLDIAGCDHLAGGEQALAAELARRMAGWKLEARWAVADTAGAAWALAHYAPQQVVPQGAQPACLAALPIEALRLAPNVASGLRQVGVRKVAELARLPRHELTRRFGADPVRRLDQAMGREAEAIRWAPPPPDWSESERLAEPILTTDSCMAVLELLAGRLCTRLAALRLGGRHFLAGFERVDGVVVQRAAMTALPVHDPAYVMALLAPLLEGLDPGFGIEAIGLAVTARDSITAQQHELGRNSQTGAQKLTLLIDTLTNRLRPGRLWRWMPQDSHIPERATQPGPALPSARGRSEDEWQHDPDTPRPIRLLAQPEKVDAMALLPDDPPVQFRWRRALHKVRAATGPERIAPEWWTAGPQQDRDYYQVEDMAGTRFWLFRSGPDWWLHGVFG